MKVTNIMSGCDICSKINKAGQEKQKVSDRFGYYSFIYNDPEYLPDKVSFEHRPKAF